MFRSMPVDPHGFVASLSGGGIPMLEHAVGVLKAIRAVDYMRFDKMLATSAGAIAASLFMSFDQDIRKLEEAVRASKTSDFFKIKPWQAFKSIFGKSNYCADNTGLKNFLLETVTEESEKRVSVSVTDMGPREGADYRCRQSIMVDGSAAHVLASSSFQKIFPPVCWDGRLYGDGGVNNLCPLPTFRDIEQIEHLYIILAATTPLLPEFDKWPFLGQLCNVIDRTMDREVAQIKELRLSELPNVTVFYPDKWVESASFLDFSENFEQIDASYEYALEVLEKRG